MADVDPLAEDIRKELDRIEAEKNQAAIKEATPPTEDDSEKPEVAENVVEPAIPVEPEEPLEVSTEAVDYKEPETKKEVEQQKKLTSWTGIKLNLIIKHKGEETEPRFLDHNGKTLYLNKPFNSYKTKDAEGNEVKYRGYLHSNLIPFCKNLSRISEKIQPDDVMLMNAPETKEYFQNAALSIMEGVAWALPSIDEAGIQLYCDITTERNSFTNNVTLQIYLVYEIENPATDVLNWSRRLEQGFAKFKSKNFELQTTLVIPLKQLPVNYGEIVQNGWEPSDYEETTSLPNKKEDRLQITGVLENSKRPRPCIVLSKNIVSAKK